MRGNTFRSNSGDHTSARDNGEPSGKITENGAMPGDISPSNMHTSEHTDGERTGSPAFPTISRTSASQSVSGTARTEYSRKDFLDSAIIKATTVRTSRNCTTIWTTCPHITTWSIYTNTHIRPFPMKNLQKKTPEGQGTNPNTRSSIPVYSMMIITSTFTYRMPRYLPTT